MNCLDDISIYHHLLAEQALRLQRLQQILFHNSDPVPLGKD